MSDFLDDSSEPTFIPSPKKESFAQRFLQTKSLEESRRKDPKSRPIPHQRRNSTDVSSSPGISLASHLSISSTDRMEYNPLGSCDGDEFPLIRNTSPSGRICRFLERCGLSGGTYSKRNEDDAEEGKDPEEPERAGIKSLDKEHESERPRSNCSVGILLASISCIFFATSSLIVKVSSLHPMELLCVRGLVQAIFVTPIVISSGNSFLGPPGSRGLLLARCTMGSVSLIMAFNAIHLIPLADASTVIFTSPVFVSLFACICLGELCTFFDSGMIGLTILGVVLVSKPTFGMIENGNPAKSSWINIVGIFCGACAAMLNALAFIVMRQLKHVHYSVTVFWFSSVLTIFGAVLTVALDGFTLPDTWLTIFQSLGIGLCGFLGQVLLTKALQLENAGPVAVARTLDIVLSFFYQITFLHDTPDVYSYVGSALVVACVLLTAFRRWWSEFEAKKDGAEPEHNRDGNVS